MTQFLTGKRALITGSSKGIGLAIAQAFLAEGAAVMICGRDSAKLDAAAGQLKASSSYKVFSHTADVSNSGDVEKLFLAVDQELGGLDILVNNAGGGQFAPAADLTVEQWNQMIGTNLSGAFYCSRQALARFRHAGGGWILNISSLAGRNPMAGGSAYNATKFGLNGMTEAMMLDHRQDNVKVSCIMPGSVDTEFGGRHSSGHDSWKIAPEDIAEIAIDILRKPSRTLVSRVEVRPARPPQK